LELILSTTLTEFSLPVFIRFLSNLRHVLGKAQQDVQARGYDEQALVQFRLAPDMLPMKTQVCIACDAAKLCVSRVSGLDAPKFENTENNLVELIQRIDNTLNWLGNVPPDAMNGFEDKSITFPVGKTATRTMRADDYVRYWALPNMFFHITTTYDILRHNGVTLGKADYLMGSEAA
jgi:uncharacterized protein